MNAQAAKLANVIKQTHFAPIQVEAMYMASKEPGANPSTI